MRDITIRKIPDYVIAIIDDKAKKTDKRISREEYLRTLIINHATEDIINEGRHQDKELLKHSLEVIEKNTQLLHSIGQALAINEQEEHR